MARVGQTAGIGALLLRGTGLLALIAGALALVALAIPCGTGEHGLLLRHVAALSAPAGASGRDALAVLLPTAGDCALVVCAFNWCMRRWGRRRLGEGPVPVLPSGLLVASNVLTYQCFWVLGLVLIWASFLGVMLWLYLGGEPW